MNEDLDRISGLLDVAEESLSRNERAAASTITHSCINDLKEITEKTKKNGLIAGAGVGAVLGGLLLPGLLIAVPLIGGAIFGKKLSESVFEEQVEDLTTRAYSILSRV